jgi:hypothetical protein
VTRISEIETLAVTSNWSTLRRVEYYVFLLSVLQLLVTANVVPSSLINFTPMMDAIRSSETLLVTDNLVPGSLIILILIIEEIRFSETSVPTRPSRRHRPEDGILHSHSRENLISHRRCSYSSCCPLVSFHATNTIYQLLLELRVMFRL